MRQTFANLESRLSARPARSCDRLATAAKFWAIKDKALLLSSSICTSKRNLWFAHVVQMQVVSSAHMLLPRHNTEVAVEPRPNQYLEKVRRYQHRHAVCGRQSW